MGKLEKSSEDEVKEKVSSWFCQKCDRLNKRQFDYCEFCYSNNIAKYKTTNKKDELNKIDKNNVKITYWDKIHDFHEQNNKLLNSYNKNTISAHPSINIPNVSASANFTNPISILSSTKGGASSRRNVGVKIKESDKVKRKYSKNSVHIAGNYFLYTNI